MFKVDNKSVCLTCKQKVNENHCLKCTNCDELHHAICQSSDVDSRICTSTFLSYYVKPSTKPNFSWICDRCKTDSESEQVATIRQLIHTMSESHKEQIQTLITQVENLTAKVDAMSAVKTTESNDATPVTNTVWDDAARIKNVKASVAVKPDGQGNVVNTKTIKKFATEKGIPIDSVVEAANGVTFINTPDVESREKVVKYLEVSHASNEVSLLKNKLPTISVMGVRAGHMLNEDDEEITKDELRENIYRQNKFIAPLMDKIDSVLEVVFVKPPPAGKKFYSVYIRVSPDIRLAIDKKMHDKIHIGAQVFSVVDRFHVKRCNRCQGLGHYADQCDPDESPITCGYCAKDHDSNDCPISKRSHTRHICINCSGTNRECTGHPAFWSKCPTYKEAQEKLKKTIPYYNNLN